MRNSQENGRENDNYTEIISETTILKIREVPVFREVSFPRSKSAKKEMMFLSEILGVNGQFDFDVNPRECSDNRENEVFIKDGIIILKR